MHLPISDDEIYGGAMSVKAKNWSHSGGVARFSAILKVGFYPDSLLSLGKEGKVGKMI
jgi:hypothetical protein